MIALWIRELFGWALLVLGLSVFRISFHYLDQRLVVEGAISMMIGFFIFRGGMQLLRIAAAARAVRFGYVPNQE